MRGVESMALAFDRACSAAGVSYVFVGGIAVMAWGQPRATSDVDAILLLPPSRADAFVKALRAEKLSASLADFDAARDDPGHVSVFDDDSHFHVDVKLAVIPDEEVQVRNAAEISLGGGKLRISPPEETVAYKLLFGSPQDTQDARSILVRQAGKLDVPRLRKLAERLRVSGSLEALLAECF